ncbi:hypothetical protein ES703_25242 [subsurface metagenome]
MRRVKGLVVSLSGLVLIILGIGMWRSPEIDWEGFLGAWSLVINDIIRLIDDPFAVLGIVVLIVGIFVAVNGLQRLVRG